jgi:hypothetical protein
VTKKRTQEDIEVASEEVIEDLESLEEEKEEVTEVVKEAQQEVDFSKIHLKEQSE